MPTRLTREQERQLATAIGRALRAARLRAGLTQKEAARVVGLSTEVLGRFERGGILPSVPTVVALYAALQVEPNELLGVGRRRPSPSGARAEGRPSRLALAISHLTPKQFRLVARLVDQLAGPR